VRLAVLAALGAAVLVPTGPAHAASGVTVLGASCGWTSVQDPTFTHQSGVIEAGPLVVVADDPAANPLVASVRCSLQLAGDRHSDPDVFSVSSAATPGVVLLPPTPFSYEDPDGALVATCTEVTVAGGPTLYLDDHTGEWTTDPGAPCGTSPYCACDDEDPIGKLLDASIALLDATVCPVLGLVPVVGHDLQVLWEDCEPWMYPLDHRNPKETT
jgi:hypothetical protein